MQDALSNRPSDASSPSVPGLLATRLCRATLEALFERRLLAAHIAHFDDTGDGALPGGNFLPYLGAPAGSGLSKDGPVQCEFAEKRAYFAATQSISRPSRIKKLRAALRTCDIDARIPCEDGFGLYHAGVQQSMQRCGMQLHMDYAPVDAKGWRIAAVVAQLACVVHTRAAQSGGVTRIYDRPYVPHRDDRWRVRGSYHFADDVVHGVRFVDVRAEDGDLMLFNSRNFHCVSAGNGRRLSMGVFLGRTRDEQYWMWS